MGDYARRKKEESETAVPAAPGMEAFWAGVAKGATQPLVDPRVPGKAADPTAMLPYIDHDHVDDPVAMAHKVIAQLSQSTARAKTHTAAKAQPYVDALIAGLEKTDERDGRFEVIRTLERLDDPSLREAVLAKFQTQTGRRLLDVITTSEWYGGRDKAQAQALISPARAKTEREIAAMPSEVRAKLIADARRTATEIANVVGRGSANDNASAQKIQRALAGKTPSEIEAIRAAVHEQTRGDESLYEQLDRSMSGGNEDEAIASLTGDPVYAASIALQNAAGNAPRIVEILGELKPHQLASLKERYPASTFVWMSVAADQQAEIGALVNGNREAATGAKVADLLRDPLEGMQADGIQLDEQSKHNREKRSTENVLRELGKMSPDELAKARDAWNKTALARGEKTWDEMIVTRFDSEDPLVFARIRALAAGNQVDATAYALQQGTHDHDQALIDDSLANPDLSSPDPAKRAAARERARAVAERFQQVGTAKAQAIAAMQGRDVSSARGDSLDTALANHTAHQAATQRFDSASDVIDLALAPEEQTRQRRKRARAAEIGTDELREHGKFSVATEVHRARSSGDIGRIATILEGQADKTAVNNIDSEYFAKYGEELFQQPASEEVAAFQQLQAMQGVHLTREEAAYKMRDSLQNRVHAVKESGPRASRTNEEQYVIDRREREHQGSEALAANDLIRKMAFGHAAGSEERYDWSIANEGGAVDGPRAEFDQHVAHTRSVSDMQREEKIALADRAAQWIAIAGKIGALATLNPAAMAAIDALVGFATIYVKSDIQGEAYTTAGADLLDLGITVLNDLAMLPISKIENVLLRTVTTLGLTSGTIIVRNDLSGRGAETTLDLVKNLLLALVVNKVGDKFEDSIGGALGKGVNIGTNTLVGGAVNGSQSVADLVSEGLDNADGAIAKRPHAARHGLHDAEPRHRLSREDHEDATRLGELRRRRATTPRDAEPDHALDAHIAELERKLRLHDEAPDHSARRRAIETHLAGAERPHPANDDSRYQTRAELVPGSEFRGRGEARPDQVHAAGMEAVEAVLSRYPDVASVKRVDASQTRKADKRAQLEATFLVTLKPHGNGEAPAPFTIRVAVGPHEGETVARTVVNPSQEGRNRTPETDAVKVRGRYVIQLSDELDTIHVERAVAHEVAELRAARDLHDQGRYAGVDALRPGSIADELSPHDLGRLAELDVLTRGIDPSVQSHARTEILALVEHMGLRAGEPGADTRFDLAKKHMNPETVHAVEALRKPHAQLPDDIASDLHAVKERASHDHAAEKARAATRMPSHDLPSTLDENGQPMSRHALAARAQQAAAARAAKSDETWAQLAALAASSSGELPLLPFEVQIGAGASMAARDRSHLVVDDRGRWQADGNPEIAQTATQSRGTKDANFGDATEVAKPDRRVPTDAISYWEDNIAAQGPVVNGRAALGLGANGELVITITKDGQELKFRVSKAPYVATGFPPEKLTGSTYGKSVRESAVAVQEVLRKVAREHSDENDPIGVAASNAIEKLKSTRFVSNEDAVQFDAILADPYLRDAIAANAELADALRISEAARHWDQVLRSDDPNNRHVFLGDWANIGREHALRSHNWVIAGTGGTAVSAAEIVLSENPKAHITMVGADEPDGLMENDQFLAMARRHADAALAARLDIPVGDGRLSVGDPQYVGRVETATNNGGSHGATWVDESDIAPAKRSKHVYDVNGVSNHARGTAYIAAIGRENDYPPVVAALLDDARRNGHAYKVTPNFHDRQYVGYTVTVTNTDGKSASVDVTGAASRFVPQADVNTWSHKDRRDYERAADWDAPAESGRFAGGLEASATQADRYARMRRERENEELNNED